MKVLIAEDDTLTREGLCTLLENEGYVTIPATDGDEAMAAFHRHNPDFVCLDIMMPAADGYQVCRKMRRVRPDVPIIFISAKAEEIDKVLGLELGADDFITKPFGTREVIARIRAVTRRCMNRDKQEGWSQPFRLHDLEVRPSELRAIRGNETIELSLREVRLLELFYMNPGRALERDLIFTKIWGIDHVPNSRTLDQHISQLRKRIESNPKQPAIIKTVHGVGYRFDLLT